MLNTCIRSHISEAILNYMYQSYVKYMCPSVRNYVKYMCSSVKSYIKYMYPSVLALEVKHHELEVILNYISEVN